MRLAGILGIAALILFARPAAAEPTRDTCNQAASIEIAQCRTAQLKALNAKLDAIYAAALASLPEHDPVDGRKTKAQLQKSQIAWRAYRDENCAYVGGQEGGASNWVSIMATDCEIAETRARIRLLTKYAVTEEK